MTREEIIRTYLEIVKEHGSLPSYSLFQDVGITRDHIRHYFNSLEKLHLFIKQNNLDNLKDFVAHEDDVFSEIRKERLSDELTKYRRFVITTVVNQKKVDEGFYNALKNYQRRQKAKLLLLPCADVAGKSQISWTFDKLLSGEFFVHYDLALNKNIFLSSIKMSAKNINPTTGLGRIGQRNGSYIFASPKQFLEYVINGNETENPSAIMTTGCLTVADYNHDRYLSERTSYIAQTDHVIGAIIVEVENNKIFHFRQIQAMPDGSFVDLGKVYHADGTVSIMTPTLVMGDYHAGWTDPKVKKGTKDLVKTIKIQDIVVHDFFDGNSINHHDQNYPLKLAQKAEENKLSLRDEIILGCNEINWLLSLATNNLIMTRGNHDARLEKYLMTAQYAYEPINHYYCLDLAKKVIEKEDPLIYAYQQTGIINNFDRIHWLQRDEEYKVGPIHLSYHGDLGLNGARASMTGLERAHGNCVVGHAHSAAILRNVWRVGTSTVLRMDYNVGASTWTQTHCLVYPNGSRQLINFIDGRWHT